MYIIAWLVPFVLLMRMIEVYRVRNLTLAHLNKLEDMAARLDLLVITGKASAEDLGVDFLRRAIEFSIHDNPTVTIWSLFYWKKVYDRQLRKHEVGEWHDKRKHILESIKQNHELVEINSRLNVFTAYYIMNKSIVVAILLNCAKCYRHCSKFIDFTHGYRPLRKISHSVNQGLTFELYNGKLFQLPG